MNFHELLTNGGLNTLTFSDPYAKIVCTCSAVSQLGTTLYIDLDTMFSAYARSGIIDSSIMPNVDVYLPSRGSFMPILNEAIDRAARRRYSLIVFDSINSFYSMYDSTQSNTGKLNHLLCVLVMLLSRYGIDLEIPVLITSMMRYHKDKGWVHSPASRRLIQYSSVTRLNVSRTNEDGVDKVILTVVKHPKLPAGGQITLSDGSIILRRPESSLP